MYCKSCGSELPENGSFCPNCGAPVEAAAPTGTRESANTYENSLDYATVTVTSIDPGSILTKGILAMVFAGATGFLGIVFGAQGKRLAAQYYAEGGQPSGKAKTGQILSKVGFGLGLGLTILYAVYISILIIAAIAAS